MSKKNILTFISKKTKSLLPSLISVLIGLTAGCTVVLIVSIIDDSLSFSSGIEGIKLILFSLFSKGRDAEGELAFGLTATNIGDLLFRATPVILTGLSVAFSFKTGLFNIGAPGQYLIGTAAVLTVALSLPSYIPSFIIWLLAFLSAVICGALWGAVPGFLKARFNVNEILAGIMTNWIAANAVTLFFENSPLRNSSQSGKIGYIMPTSEKGIATLRLGLNKIFPYSQVNGGIIIAIFIAIVIYILLSKTTFGYEAAICANSKEVARYAGINIKGKTVTAMAVSGALAASGAALYWLSGNTEFYRFAYQSLPKEGFVAIPVSLLAANNPIGIIFSALFMSMLNISAQELKGLTGFNEYITEIIIALILYLSAFSLFISKMISSRKTGGRIK